MYPILFVFGLFAVAGGYVVAASAKAQWATALGTILCGIGLVCVFLGIEGMA
jgi:hypothetical protein